jgi:HD-like signal output (HDOD) protein
MSGGCSTAPVCEEDDTLSTAVPVIDHKDLLSSAEALGALPVTVTRLANIVSNPEHDIREIVEIVSLDQSLAATLLRRANSAALGARFQIKTVKDAALWLGSGSLLSLALATNVSKRLNQPIPAYGLGEGQLWKRSVAASLAAESIRTAAAVDVPAEAPTAALLHDFGKVVLAQHFGARVLNMLAQAAVADNMGLLAAEARVFGINHADIGGLVAQHWKLPHTIVDAIIHHHHGGEHRNPASATVSLAHAMVPHVLAGTDYDELPTPVACTATGSDPVETHAPVLSGLGIAPEAYPALLETARARYTELAGRYDAD